jgi:hypothetical protein
MVFTQSKIALSSLRSLPVALFKGVGEVVFADSVTVGILFLAGIAIVSLRGAPIAISGAFVGIIFPTLLNANLNAIEMGLYAFNPVLTMMAIGWVFLKPREECRSRRAGRRDDGCMPSGSCQFPYPHRPADSHVPVCSGHVDVPVCRRNVQILD